MYFFVKEKNQKEELQLQFDISVRQNIRISATAAQSERREEKAGEQGLNSSRLSLCFPCAGTRTTYTHIQYIHT